MCAKKFDLELKSRKTFGILLNSISQVFYSNCHNFASISWRLVLSIIDSILRVLTDGYWHNIKDVAEYFGYSEIKTVIIIKFLSEFGFVNLSKNKNQVKLSPPMFKFMTELQI